MQFVRLIEGDIKLRDDGPHSNKELMITAVKDRPAVWPNSISWDAGFFVQKQQLGKIKSIQVSAQDAFFPT